MSFTVSNCINIGLEALSCFLLFLETLTIKIKPFFKNEILQFFRFILKIIWYHFSFSVLINVVRKEDKHAF